MDDLRTPGVVQEAKISQIPAQQSPVEYLTPPDEILEDKEKPFTDRPFATNWHEDGVDSLWHLSVQLSAAGKDYYDKLCEAHEAALIGDSSQEIYKKGIYIFKNGVYFLYDSTTKSAMALCPLIGLSHVPQHEEKTKEEVAAIIKREIEGLGSHFLEIEGVDQPIDPVEMGKFFRENKKDIQSLLFVEQPQPVEEPVKKPEPLPPLPPQMLQLFQK